MFYSLNPISGYLKAVSQYVNTGSCSGESLFRRLDNIKKILSWMSQTLSGGSIFPDCTGRVMTSDEVIVFKTGNLIDKAVLLCALSANHGRKADIKIMDDRVIVRTADTLIDMHKLKSGCMP